MIELIAFDLDGTALLEDHLNISKATQLAFEKAAKNGIHIVPASGRLPKIMPKQILDLPTLQYGICANGALIYDFVNHSILHLDIIPYETSAAIVNVLKEYPPFSLHMFSGEDSYMDNQGLAILEREKDTFRVQALLKDNQVIVENIYESVLNKDIDISKITLPPMEKSLQTEIWEKLSKIPGTSLTTSLPGNIEINSDKVSKATGLKALCEKLKIPIENTMAIGDSSNDKEILQAAGLGVAMGNASDEIKNIADCTTKTNTEDGVAYAIEKYILKSNN